MCGLIDLAITWVNAAQGVMKTFVIAVVSFVVLWPFTLGMFWYLLFSGVKKATPFLMWFFKYSAAGALVLVAAGVAAVLASPAAGLGVLGILGMAVVDRLVHDIKKPMQAEKRAS